jgi:3-oxoadipate enol-lactonase
MDGVGVERAMLLAESFGGAVALESAIAFPERIAALALVNTFAYYPRRLRLSVSRLFAPFLPAGQFHRGRAALAPWILFGDFWRDEALHRFRREGGRWFDEGYRRRLIMAQRLDLRTRLGEVRQPVAVFAGDRDLIVPSASQASFLRSRLPDAESFIVRGGGHLILPLEGLPWSDWLRGLERRAALDGDAGRSGRP